MDETQEPLGYLGSLIRRAQQRHVAVWLTEVSTEVTSVQYAALAVLTHQPGMSQRELGDALDIDRSTVAGIVSRLERDGLIARITDPDDGRRKVLTPTPQGQRAYAELKPKVVRAQDVLAAELDAQQRQQLNALLRILVTDSP